MLSTLTWPDAAEAMLWPWPIAGIALTQGGERRIMERTLVIIKPDGVQRGLIGEITTRLEQRGLKPVGIKLKQLDRALAEEHYAVHRGKPFFEGLINYIISAPVVLMVWEGPGAIRAVRSVMGATDPMKASPGTVRADFGLDVQRNLTHGSDARDSAQREIDLFFEPDELLDWSRDVDPWIYRKEIAMAEQVG